MARVVPQPARRTPGAGPRCRMTFIFWAHDILDWPRPAAFHTISIQTTLARRGRAELRRAVAEIASMAIATTHRADYSILPVPPERKLTVDGGRLAARKHTVMALVEVDVTRARRLMRAHKARTG